ncbi:MAG: hypothetical protein HYX22_00120 [Candidatus Yanofskybacteria bacterium]|nr:hypothetical protein [Candidatus Yanofskybacteria bacterium]
MNNSRDVKIFIIAPLLAIALFYAGNFFKFSVPALDIEKLRAGSTAKLEEQIIPLKGARLPVSWGNLGVQMVNTGVIDAAKFENLYSGRGGMSDEMKGILYEADNKELVIAKDNAGFLLNVLWALGLSNKNDILEKGPMTDKRYGGADRFASTGGWSLSDGNTMEHYSRHKFLILTPDQQKLVEEVSKNIYRPCCNNPTYFPDCNHGMAMLGLLELMASQGIGEEEIYHAALAVNSYWFPDTYSAIAQFLQTKNFDWRKAEPKDLLGYNFSSASGYQQILSELKPVNESDGGSCGV